MDLLTGVPVTSFLIFLISSSLLLTVAVGGALLLRRQASRVKASSPPQQTALSQPIARWDSELAAKIDRLEKAFAVLVRRLESMERLGAGERRGPAVLSKPLVSRKQALAQVLDLHAGGLSPGAIAQAVGMSEEQVRLLLGRVRAREAARG